MWQMYGEKETCGTKGGLVSGWKQGMKSVSNNEWREVSRSHSKLMAANIGEGLNFRRHKQYHFKSFRHSLLVVLLSIAAMVAGVILLGRMLQTQTNEAFLYLAEPAYSFWWVFTSCIARYLFAAPICKTKFVP